MTFSTLSGNKLSGLSGAADFSNTSTGSYTGYKYVTFTASGSLVVTRAGFADIVVCGGGGGAGNSGGGGAGGVLIATSIYLPVGTLTVIVGAGGAMAVNGSTSRMDNFYGVGGGSCQLSQVGVSGGSGGAAGSAAGAGGSGVSGQGNAGGTTGAGGNAAGSGGGGAGGVGTSVTGGAVGGNGGAGTTTSIAGTAPTGAYSAGAYALGGGGGGGGHTGAGTGGSGGGGERCASDSLLLRSQATVSTSPDAPTRPGSDAHRSRDPMARGAS